jgi:tRNA threonylcarbamoyladenosine biosynthesis protein TsaE
MSGIRSQIAAVITLIWLIPAGASAHPHVWIETHAAFDFDHNQLVAVDLDWLFDDMFSAQLIEDFDHGKKGSFDAADQAELEKQVLPGYADFAYYTHVRVDGKEVKIARTGNFHATLENGQVRFRYTAFLPQPVDPAKHRIDAGFYDETFFVDLGFSAHDPITFKGTTACTDTVAPDPAHKIYFGQVTPEIVKVTCKPA